MWALDQRVACSRDMQVCLNACLKDLRMRLVRLLKYKHFEEN